MPTNSLDECEISNSSPAGQLQPLPPGIAPGAQIHVRGARWRIEQSVARQDCCELHLVSETNAGRRVLLWPFDRPAPVEGKAILRVVRLRRWWRAVVAAARSEVGPFTPRPRRVRADVLPYQLEPALAMARGAMRIVLADEVGLGKTVQAGWIIGDLVERERDARVLIAVPGGLRQQWVAELDTLFGLAAASVDARWLRATVADLPADVSPWTAPGIYIASIDFLKRPVIASSLQRKRWDLLVVDEAHGAAAPTERHAVLSAVAARAQRVVAITATPFSGDPNAFSSIAALGEGSKRFAAPIMFRRSREDIGDRRKRRHRFASVRLSRPEFVLQRLLERYGRHVWRAAGGDLDAARLAVTVLRKRALSSPAAAERSLRRRLALLRGVATAPRQLSLIDDETETADDDLAESALAVPGLADAAREHRWLAALVDAAAAALVHDSKLRRLLRLRQRAGAEPTIVFTEYRDTLRHLSTAIPDSLQLHGGLTATERAAVQQRFNENGGWLLATDAGSEGLNLQHRCRLVVNYELPWNPARLEQRIGRVDRIGQRRTVHAVTLIARDTAEDLVVANLTKRLTRVAATLGDRDRLASFLDDARMARRVIGGTDPADSAVPAASDSPLDAVSTPPSGLHAEAARSAIEIRLRAAAADRMVRTPVTAMRATSLLLPGYVGAFHCAAITAAGQVVAQRLVLLHARETVTRPRKAADVLERSGLAIAALAGHLESVVPHLAAWFEEIQSAHAAAVEAQIEREAAVRDALAGLPPIQKGLFDRRAENEADRQVDLDRALRAEASDRIRDLECRRDLRMAVSPAGVLLLWR